MSQGADAMTVSAGRWAEDLALSHLRRQGLSLEDRNYRCRRGEIDLIMADGATLVFVEVRYRARSNFGDGSQSIDRRKQRRIVFTAQHYLQRHPRAASRPCRFDVVSVSGTEGNAVHWIPNAFDVSG